MRRSHKVIGVLAVTATVAAAGSAFTASVDTTAVAHPVAGYGKVTVDGAATLTGLNLARSGDGSTFTQATLTFATAVTNSVTAGFDAASIGASTCTGNAADTPTVGTAANTVYTCTWSSDPAVGSTGDFSIVVS